MMMPAIALWAYMEYQMGIGYYLEQKYDLLGQIQGISLGPQICNCESYDQVMMGLAIEERMMVRVNMNTFIMRVEVH